LPNIFRQRIDATTLHLDHRPDDVTDAGLAAFVAQPDWPTWAHDA
jgi:hypothetical protein